MSNSPHFVGAHGFTASENPGAAQKARLERAEKRAARSAQRKEVGERFKNEGNELFRKQDFEAAKLCYIAAIKGNGPHPVYLSNLAAAYLKLEFEDLAEDAATEALMRDPRMIKARYRRGQARKESFLLNQALTDFETILRNDPRCSAARIELSAVRTLMDVDGIEVDDDQSVASQNDWPHFEDEGWDIASVSDSGDYNHTGNGTPCRFYNHAGCNRGEECRFSHAPDDHSVRDDLGKNVCLYFLLGACRFNARCIYSHSKANLAVDGWWNDDQQIIKAKQILDNMKLTGRYRAPFGRPGKEKYGLPGTSKHEFISHWLKAQSGSAKYRQPIKVQPNAKPFVMLLSLENESFFASIHAHLLSALDAKLHVSQALTAKRALEHFASPDLVGVFVTDPGITNEKNAHVCARLVKYAKSGGRVVIGGLFSSFITGSEMGAFFRDVWGLPWKMGDYHRTTFSLNPSAKDMFKNKPTLPPSYSMKAVHLKGVNPKMRCIDRQKGLVSSRRSSLPPQ